MKRIVLSKLREGAEQISTLKVDDIIPDQLIIPKDKYSILKNSYDKIYSWHIAHGLDEGELFWTDKEEGASYFSILSKLESPQKANIQQMIQAAYEVQQGRFSWANDIADELVEEADKIIQITIDYSGEKIDLLRKKVKSKKDAFKNAAQNFLTTKYKELQELNKPNTHIKNLGGLVALMETNAQFTIERVVSPHLVGFNEITDENSLVQHVLRGNIEVEEVWLDPGFEVDLKIRNKTDEKSECILPKGQLFENKVFKCMYQNLRLIKEKKVIINPRDFQHYILDASCINAPFAAPKGHKGNLTVYSYDSEGSYSQRALWRSMNSNGRNYGSRWKVFKSYFNLNSAMHEVYQTKKKLAIVGLLSLVFISAYWILI